MHVRYLLLVALTVASLTVQAQGSAHRTDVANEKMNRFVSSLMKRMTLGDLIGQLNLGAGADPQVLNNNLGIAESAERGQVGACGGADAHLQQLAVEKSPAGIPILFGLDVIHGYATTFPIPLAQACSWNLELIKRGAQIAAKEATANGIEWTWSPMVDIARDPRWGRVAEGAGEDPYLGSLIAKAMVQGYQGDDLASDSTLLCCFKHFALYGAAEAGRDYNTVDMSRWMMYNYYLPPYKAAVEAGAGSGMSSFNVIDGVPATGNKWLLTDLLRQQWGFKGFIVSDANSVGEMENHRVGDAKEVARLGLVAGMNMDMGSMHYVRNIKQLLKEGKITMTQIRDLVRPILEAKYKLGLFDDPYRYTRLMKDSARQADVLSDAHVAFARKLAGESMVLLKNEGSLLPLSSSCRRVAVVGPIGNDVAQLYGTWSTKPDGRKSHTVRQALALSLGDGCTVTYTQGCESDVNSCYDFYNDTVSAVNSKLIAEAVAEARQADVVVACVGEQGGWSGEAWSRVNLELPVGQRQLLKALRDTGKPIVIVVFSGRPLILTDIDRNFPCILEAWHLGTSAGDALADVLTGKVNPSGKTTITFPRYEGQIPIYYNCLNTGRPQGVYKPDWFTPTYKDIPMADNRPLYPFGYGLSYNRYTYSNLRADKVKAKGDNDSIRLSIDVTNEGSREGKEIVQLYITDLIASTSRPVKELKGFRKLDFKPGETKTVSFTVKPDLLSFYNSKLEYGWEPGDFEVAIAPNSTDLHKLRIHWDK